MAICSRNYSLCCTVLSGWGIIQLIVMGFLFYYQAIAFSEDLNIEIKEHEDQNITEFWAEAEDKYQSTVSAFDRMALLHHDDRSSNSPYITHLFLTYY